MSDLYLDEIEKIKYFKEKLFDKYVRQGVALNKEKIQDQLDRIDTKLAIFSQAYIQSGSEFDADTFNEQKRDIYRDLLVLYTVLYKLVKERVNKAEERVRVSLEDLEAKAKRFRFLTDTESVAIYGKPIFHQVSGFNQSYQNGQVHIDIGPLDVASGSYLACLLQCAEVEPSQITFQFDADNVVSTYQYDSQMLKVTGNYKIDTTFYENEETIFGKELIELDETVSPQNTYQFFLNKDQIKTHNLTNATSSYVTFTPGIFYQTAGAEEIIFYVYGASYIAFDLVGETAYTNFSGQEIKTPRYRQKIVIKTEGKFSFDIRTDGTIFAEKVDSVIQDDRLKLMGNYENIADYMVETISYGEDVHFDDVKIIVDDVTDTLLDIDYIVIKQTQVTELDSE